MHFRMVLLHTVIKIIRKYYLVVGVFVECLHQELARILGFDRVLVEGPREHSPHRVTTLLYRTLSAL